MKRSENFSARELGVLLLLLALLSAGICLLHAANAVRPCGTAEASALEECREGYAPEIESVTVSGGTLFIRGYLAKPGQYGGTAEVRVGLLEGGTVRLLNTEMVRRGDVSKLLDCDDHCGAAAAARLSGLPEGSYEIVFADSMKKMIRTGDSLVIRAGEAEWKQP